MGEGFHAIKNTLLGRHAALRIIGPLKWILFLMNYILSQRFPMKGRMTSIDFRLSAFMLAGI